MTDGNEDPAGEDDGSTDERREGTDGREGGTDDGTGLDQSGQWGETSPGGDAAQPGGSPDVERTTGRPASADALGPSLAELDERLSRIETQLDRLAEGSTSRRSGPRTAVRATDEVAIPAVIGVLRGTIHSLEALQGAIRLLEGDRDSATFDGSGERPAGHGREEFGGPSMVADGPRRARALIDDAIATLGEGIEGDPDGVTDRQTARLLEELRELRNGVDRALQGDESEPGPGSNAERDARTPTVIPIEDPEETNGPEGGAESATEPSGSDRGRNDADTGPGLAEPGNGPVFDDHAKGEPEPAVDVEAELEQLVRELGTDAEDSDIADAAGSETHASERTDEAGNETAVHERTDEAESGVPEPDAAVDEFPTDAAERRPNDGDVGDDGAEASANGRDPSTEDGEESTDDEEVNGGNGLGE